MEKDQPPPYPGPPDPTFGAPYLANPGMYPAPPVYSPAAPQPDATAARPVIQSQPAVMVVTPVVVQPAMRDVPALLRCAFCQQDIVTVTRPVTGLLTWTVFGILLFFLVWPCCLIPFCVSSCQDVQHSCPSCKNVLHIHRRM